MASITNESDVKVSITADTSRFSEAWKRAMQQLAVRHLRERYPDLKLEAFSDIAVVADMLEDAGDHRCEELRKAHATNGTSEAFRFIKAKALQVDMAAMQEGIQRAAAAMASLTQVLAAEKGDGRSPPPAGMIDATGRRRQRRRNLRRDPAAHNVAATPAFLRKPPPMAASRRRGSARGR